MNAPPEDADVETASPGYAGRFASPVGEWMLATQWQITTDLLQDIKSGSVLDVGGGHGQVAPALARQGRAVHVLASSEGAVSEALRPSVDSGVVKLIVGDLRNPPVDPQSYDAVLSYRLLAHAQDLPALIAGLARSARRAVVVDYATTRSFNAAADFFFAAKKRVEQNTRPFAVTRDADLVGLFQRNGFKLRARRPQFFWPMALHRALGSPVISRILEGLGATVGLRALLGSPVIARFDRV